MSSIGLRALFPLAPLMMAACLFQEKGDESDTSFPSPAPGQWKQVPDNVYTVRDSLYRQQFAAILEARGITQNGELVGFIPTALIDSFEMSFSCQSTACDSVLWIGKAYLNFTSDSVTRLRFQNESLTGRWVTAFRVDRDSFYLDVPVPFDDLSGSGNPYRISRNGDTLEIGEPDHSDIYIRNADPLPD